MAWWDSRWQRRKSHTITGSSDGALTNYQMFFKVYYGSGTDGTESVYDMTAGKVYCDSECRTDFGDIRFTDDNENELDYWIEKFEWADYALIWVELSSIAASPSTETVYIYFRNKTTESASNVDNTFIYGNNMRSLSEFTADFSKVSGDDAEFEWRWLDNMVRLPDTSDSVSTEYNNTGMGLPSTGKYRVRWYHAGASVTNRPFTHLTLKNSGGSRLVSAGARGGALSQNEIYPTTQTTFGTYEEGTLYLWSLIIDAANDQFEHIWVEDGDSYTTDESFGATGPADEISLSGVGTASGYTGYSSWGPIYITNYTDNEPTHGSWGGKEGEAVSKAIQAIQLRFEGS